MIPVLQSVCCVSVCSHDNCQTERPLTFVHFDPVYVKFVGQGYRLKPKVIGAYEFY